MRHSSSLGGFSKGSLEGYDNLSLLTRQGLMIAAPGSPEANLRVLEVSGIDNGELLTISLCERIKRRDKTWNKLGSPPSLAYSVLLPEPCRLSAHSSC